MDEKTTKASLCYQIIEHKANANSVLQALTGIVGFPFTTIVDVGVIPAIYDPLCNGIREVYGYQPIDSDDVLSIVSNIYKEILMDLVMDKILGNVPLIGIYFNGICAKHMTWRLGILFAMLSARGEEVVSSNASECMKLIRLTFPQEKALSFTTPDKIHFMRLVTAISDSTPNDFSSTINKGLSAMEQ